MYDFILQKFEFKHLINDTTIDLLIFKKFCKYWEYKMKYNPIVNFSNVTSNRVVAIGYNQVFSLMLSVRKYDK